MRLLILSAAAGMWGSWAHLQPDTRGKQVANIQSGNYCQPRCAEPWTEVIFTDPAEGKVQVLPLLSAQLSICVPGNSNSLKCLLRAEPWREAPESKEATSASPSAGDRLATSAADKCFEPAAGGSWHAGRAAQLPGLLHHVRVPHCCTAVLLPPSVRTSCPLGVPRSHVNVSRKDECIWEMTQSRVCRRGTYLDEEDVRKTDKKSFDGRTYYQYEAYAPYGSLGPHTLSSVTVKVRLMSCSARQMSCSARTVCTVPRAQGCSDSMLITVHVEVQGELLLLFTISANDKQWGKSEKKLRQVHEFVMRVAQ